MEREELIVGPKRFLEVEMDGDCCLEGKAVKKVADGVVVRPMDKALSDSRREEVRDARDCC